MIIVGNKEKTVFYKEGMTNCNMKQGDTFMMFGHVYLVDKVYLANNPDLHCQRRIKAHVLTSGFVDAIDCAYPEI